MNEYLETIDLSSLSFFTRFLLNNKVINIVVEEEISNTVYGFKISDNRVQSFINGGYENARDIVFVKESVLENIKTSDINVLLKSEYDKGNIHFEQFGLFSPVTSFLLNRFLGKREKKDKIECLNISQREYYAQEDSHVKERPTALSRNVCQLRMGDTVFSPVNDLYDVEGGFVYIVIKNDQGEIVCCGYIDPRKIGTMKRSRDIGVSEATEAERGAVTGRKG